MTKTQPETLTTIGWIVDVQRDFMLPPQEGGRLYVQDQQDPSDPGAQVIRSRIARAVHNLRKQGALLVFTGDWHDFRDAEIDTANPDFQNTYPPHCMGRTDDRKLQQGAQILEEIAPENPLVLEVDASPLRGREVARRAVQEHREVWVRKTRFDVFRGNRATQAFLAELTRRMDDTAPEQHHTEMTVLGVARDVCVNQAVEGMLQRGYQPRILRDCIWGLGLEPEEETLNRWKKQGAKLTTFE